MDQPQVTWDYLAKECSGRRVLGQLDPLTLPQVHISRFRVMLKGDSGKWCLIVGIFLPPGWDTSPAQRRNCVGKLGHASRAVVPGKMFMQRMFELLAGVRQTHHHVRLNGAFHSDHFPGGMEWGGHDAISRTGAASTSCLDRCLGQLQMQSSIPPFTDVAAVALVRTVLTGGLQFYEQSILLQEILPIILACAVWGPGRQDSSMLVYCNNLGMVAVVNTGYSKVPQIMHLLRCLFFIRVIFHLSVRVVHVPGIQNSWADGISRSQLPLLFSQDPGAVGRQ